MDENARRYDGWTIDITGGRRAVASLLFDPAGTQKIKKPPPLALIAVR
jgi:hypothetical protein